MVDKQGPQIGAAEFKAKCLELIEDIHARKRNSVIITKRGKPYAKLVPVDCQEEPFFGCMAGLAAIHGDLTEPVDVESVALR